MSNEILRVKRFTIRYRERGYTDLSVKTVQRLQAKTKFGWWETIDEEEVPESVIISLGCFGDNGGWVSKFVKYGSFGKDGIIHPLKEPHS